MTYTPIKDWSDDDKPREKLAKWGADKLSDSELLAILISTGSRGKSAIELAKELLKSAENDVNTLAKFGISDIKNVKGLGDAKAITILAALELSKRRSKKNQKEIILGSISEAVEYVRPYLIDRQQEHFYSILLNKRNKVIKLHEVSKGGISTVTVDPRIILKEAINLHASSIIIAHNHPSGSLKPSRADDKLTKRMNKAAQLMQIRLLDHIIISDKGYFSYLESSDVLIRQ